MGAFAKTLPPKANLTGVPECIMVLPLGHITSVKGNFLVDEKSFSMMKEYMDCRGIDIVIDYEHQTLKNIQAPAGGWIRKLILKNDGVYAEVEWTERAKSYLRNREYRYLSPVVQIRKSDRRVSRIHSVALTNAPAINGMKPIINSAAVHDGRLDESKRLNETQKEICRMLNIEESDYAAYRSGGAGLWMITN